jgi:hypothetical protein
MDHDQTQPTETGPVDTPPKSGEFADWDGAQLDPGVIAEGNRLGQTIDPDDDTDNGGVQ